MKLKAAIFGLAATTMLSACMDPGGQPGDPVVEFSNAEYQVNEADGTATITVVRKGDSSTPVSIGYSTNPDTATPGSDYRRTSGVLQWQPGDPAEKTFDIPILADAELERRERIVLNLGSADGVEIGTTDRATLTILDSACAGELSDNITAPRTLSNGCYLVTNDIFVQPGGRLTIEPGATLIFEAGARMQVEEGGALIAVGTPEQPITFTAAQKEPGYWNGLSFFGSDDDANQLSHVKLEYGGLGPDGANLSVRGNSFSGARLKISDVHLTGSGGYGFHFAEDAQIDNFTGIVTAGNESGAGLMPMTLIPVLDPASSHFAGNKRDYLDILPGALETDQNWPQLDVPYGMRAGGHRIHASLTLAPGVVLGFARAASLIIEDSGVLTAQGTDEQRIRLTGQKAESGYWAGLEIAGTPDEGDNTIVPSRLDYCSIEYAGGGFQGAISLTGRTGISLASISHSNIIGSAGYGIWLAPENAFIQQSGNYFGDDQAGDINF